MNQPGFVLWENLVRYEVLADLAFDLFRTYGTPWDLEMDAEKLQIAAYSRGYIAGKCMVLSSVFDALQLLLDLAAPKQTVREWYESRLVEEVR